MTVTLRCSARFLPSIEPDRELHRIGESHRIAEVRLVSVPSEACPGGGWLAVVVPAAMALGLVQLARRKLAEAPDRDWMAGQPVVFETRGEHLDPGGGRLGCAVGTPPYPGRTSSGRPSGRAGSDTRPGQCPDLRERHAHIRRHDVGRPVRVAWCIRLRSMDGRVNWAVIPRGASLEECWQALLSVGVAPAAQRQPQAAGCGFTRES
jgi:hypothetical protein